MILALLLACPLRSEAEDDSSRPTDPDSGEVTTPTDPCAGQPTVTWANFGEGFMLGYCQPCHASDAPDRHGAPESVVFDTEADVILHAERIRARSLGEGASMPPGGGVPEADRELLEIWLECGL